MLVDLSLLVLHLLLVLVLLEQYFVLVVLLDLLDSREEVLVLALFLSLQLRELLCVVQHLAGVLIPLLLDLVLLLVEELSSFDLFGVLRLLDLSQKGLFLVLSLLGLGDELGFFLGDRALLRLHIELDVDLHIGFFLVLVLRL